MENKNAEATTNENAEVKKVEGAGIETQAIEKKDEGTQAELISKEEAQKMADAIVAKKLKGMPTKEEVKAWEDWKESQKTVDEKKAEEAKKAMAEALENVSLKQKLSIADKEVLKEYRGYVHYEVSQLAGDFDENLDKFLKDNPKYLSEVKEVNAVGKTTGVKVQGQSTKEDGVTAILKAKHPELF